MNLDMGQLGLGSQNICKYFIWTSSASSPQIQHGCAYFDKWWLWTENTESLTSCWHHQFNLLTTNYCGKTWLMVSLMSSTHTYTYGQGQNSPLNKSWSCSERCLVVGITTLQQHLLQWTSWQNTISKETKWRQSKGR